MESNKELKLSKHQRRKARRYGKVPTELSCLESNSVNNLSKNQRHKLIRYGKKPTDSPKSATPSNRNTDPGHQFIKSLLKPRPIQDHSLDELELHELEVERKRHSVLRGSFETRKRR